MATKDRRSDSPSGDVTLLLEAARDGGADALDALVGHVYQELRRTAGALVRKEPPGATLPATALVHEAFLRLFVGQTPSFGDRRHFFGSAAIAMRRILVEEARRRKAGKRVPAERMVPLEGAHLVAGSDEIDVDVLALDQALENLARQNPRQAKIVELRYFAGLTESEVADLLEVSRMTVSREWRIARLRLMRDMHDG